MSSPPLRGTAEWSATREVALLLGLTGGNRYAAQQLWLRNTRSKHEACPVPYSAHWVGPTKISWQVNVERQGQLLMLRFLWFISRNS